MTLAARIAAFLFASGVAVAALAQGRGAQPPFAPQGENDRVIYRDATLIDGTGGPAQPHMAVIVKGDRIEAVLPVASLTPAQAKGARTVDLSGRYLLPGLIESHQHLATPPNAKRARALMRRDIYSGVTATRIMADDLRSIAELAREARIGEIAGPDLYFAALVAGPGFFDDPRTSAAATGYAPGTAPWMQAIDDTTDLPLAIARARGTGASALKIYADLPPHLVRALAAEAHRQGLPVWAHGMVFPTKPEDVIAAGPDVISHTCYLAYQLSENPPQVYRDRNPVNYAAFEGGDNEVMARLFAEMKRRNILLDPTLRVYGEVEKRSAGSGRPPYCTLDLAAKLTAQAHRAGIPLSTGTDGDTPREDPYPSVFEEYELLVSKAGLTPAEAIHSATAVGAQTLGHDKEMGTIAPGKLANLVVLEKNPLDAIANMRSVLMTVKRGRIFNRKDFTPITAEELPDND